MLCSLELQLNQVSSVALNKDRGWTASRNLGFEVTAQTPTTTEKGFQAQPAGKFCQKVLRQAKLP